SCATRNSSDAAGGVMPKVVIIGAGIVGCALADELTARGWTDVTVLDQGPLFATGGSSSHAPGLVFQTNGAKAMADFAQYTVQKYVDIGCFRVLGGLHVPSDGAALAVAAGEAQARAAQARGAVFLGGHEVLDIETSGDRV